MARPLQVYLDSCDYSVLSDNPSPAQVEILQGLRNRVDKGLIEIRFSGISVLEATHLDTKYKPAALRRAEVMRDLCRGKCLRDWRTVVADDCAALAQGRTLDKCHSYDDTGRWFPDFLRARLSNGLQSTPNLLQRMIADHNGTRAQKRQAQRLILKHGQLTPLARQLLQAGASEIADRLQQEFPCSPRLASGLFLDFMLGTVSADEIVREVEATLSDVVSMVGWAVDKFDSGKKLPMWLRQSGDKFMKVIAGIEGKFMSLEPDETDIPFIKKMMADKLAPEKIRVLWMEMMDGLDKEACEKAGIMDSPLGSLPALDALSEVFSYHVQSSITFGAKNARGLKPSDFGDLIQFAHMPSVDLFRADSHAAQRGAKVAARYGVQVVSKLTHLLPAIDQCLGRRQHC